MLGAHAARVSASALPKASISLRTSHSDESEDSRVGASAASAPSESAPRSRLRRLNGARAAARHRECGGGEPDPRFRPVGPAVAARGLGALAEQARREIERRDVGGRAARARHRRDLELREHARVVRAGGLASVDRERLVEDALDRYRPQPEPVAVARQDVVDAPIALRAAEPVGIGAERRRRAAARSRRRDRGAP